MHRNRQTRLDPVQEIDALFGVHRDSPEQYACPSQVDDRCVDVEDVALAGRDEGSWDR
jgi:hypothetical protein